MSPQRSAGMVAEAAQTCTQQGDRLDDPLKRGLRRLQDVFLRGGRE